MSVSDRNPNHPLYQTPGHWTSWALDTKEEQNWQETASLLKKYPCADAYEKWLQNSAAGLQENARINALWCVFSLSKKQTS